MTDVARPRVSYTVAVSAIAISTVLTIFLAGFAHRSLGDDVCYSAILVGACCLTVVLSSAQKNRALPIAATALTLLGWAPYVFGGAASALNDPLVDLHRWRCGTGDIALGFLLLLSFPLILTPGLLFIPFARRRPFRTAVHFAAIVVVTLGAALLFGALLRAHKVQPLEYVASLAVETNAAVTSQILAAAGASDGSATPPGLGFESPPREGDEATAVLRDGAHGLWIVKRNSGRLDAYARVAGVPQSVAIYARQVASSLRPPTAWVVLDAAGCFCGLLAFAAARRERRRARVWRAARAGVHVGDGWIRFADSSPPDHMAHAALLPEGDVLVLDPARLSPTYREHGRAGEHARVTAGDLEAIMAAAGDRAMALRCVALLVGALSSAPMLVAFLDGLLG